MPCSSEVKKFVTGFYTHAASQCVGLDVRILLSNVGNTADLQLTEHILHKKYCVSFTDCDDEAVIDLLGYYIKSNFPQGNDGSSEVKVLNEVPFEERDELNVQAPEDAGLSQRFDARGEFIPFLTGI